VRTITRKEYKEIGRFSRVCERKVARSWRRLAHSAPPASSPPSPAPQPEYRRPVPSPLLLSSLTCPTRERSPSPHRPRHRWVIGAVGWEGGEEKNQPTGFSSSQAKMTRTKDDEEEEEEEDYVMTLNRYMPPTPMRRCRLVCITVDLGSFHGDESPVHHFFQFR
jgi:hypothetical protein